MDQESFGLMTDGSVRLSIAASGNGTFNHDLQISGELFSVGKILTFGDVEIDKTSKAFAMRRATQSLLDAPPLVWPAP